MAGISGVLAGARHPLHRRLPKPVAGPAWLLDAADRERALLASVDAAGETNFLLATIRSDHADHLSTLDAMMAAAPRPTAIATGTAAARPDVRQAELDAAAAGANASLELSGAEAALLASISACEASHAELLR
ncbi:MAG: hypothetical protein ABJB98_09085 [Actinomycetota bacterium]